MERRDEGLISPPEDESANALALAKAKAKAKAKAQRERESEGSSEAPEDEEFTGMKAFINAISPTAVKMWDASQESDEDRKARKATPEFKAQAEENLANTEMNPFMVATQAPGVGQLQAASIPNMKDPLMVAGEALDVPRRALGAGLGSIPGMAEFVGRKENQSFLNAMADPSTGVFKQVKAAVRTGDSSATTKLVLDFGLTLAEDPLIFFTGLYKAGLAMKAVSTKNAARTALAKTGIKGSDEILEKASVPELGGVAKGNIDPAIQATPVQQLAIEGKEASKGIIKQEEKALGTMQKSGIDIRKSIDKDNAEVVTNQLRSIKERHGFADDAVDGIHPVSKFRKHTEEKLGSRKEAFDDEMAEVFAKIDSQLDEVGKIDDEAINIVSSKIDDVTKTKKVTVTKPGKTPTQTTKPLPEDGAEFSRLMGEGKIIPDPVGKGFKWVDETVEAVPDVITTSKKMGTHAELGVNRATMGRLKDLNIRIKQGLKYSELKKERSKLGKHLWDTKSETTRELPINDYDMLRDVYNGLTDSMGSMIKNNLGDGALAEWKASNQVFSATSHDYKIAQKIMRQKTPERIIDDLAKKTKRAQDIGIKSLIKTLPGKNLQTFKNMWFNDIINKATKKGVVDGDKLTKILKEQPAIVFNEIFDAKMIDDLVDLGKNSKAAKTAREAIIKANTDQSRWSKFINDPWVRLAMMRGKEPSTIVLSEGAKLGGQSVLKRMGVTKAENFLRQVDQTAIIPAFLKGNVLGGKLETLKYPSTRPEPTDDPMGFGDR